MAENVKVLITGKDKASPAVKKVSTSMKGLKTATAGLNTAMKSLAPFLSGAAFIGGMKLVINKAAEQEQIFRKLATTVRISGNAYGDVSGEIDRFLNKMQDTTEFGDTEMAEVLTTMTIMTGDLDDSFRGAKLAADIAASGFFNLSAATRNVGLLMAGNIEMLGKYFPELKKTALEARGLTTETQQLEFAFDHLSQLFAGSAVENVKTYTGRLNQMNDSLDDLEETIGDKLLPTLTTWSEIWNSLLRSKNPIDELSDSQARTVLAAEIELLNEYETELQKLNDIKWGFLGKGKKGAREEAEEGIKRSREAIDELRGRISLLQKESIIEDQSLFDRQWANDMKVAYSEMGGELESMTTSLEKINSARHPLTGAFEISEAEWLDRDAAGEWGAQAGTDSGEGFTDGFSMAAQSGLQAGFSATLQPLFKSLGFSSGNSFGGAFIQAFLSQLAAQLATKLAFSLAGGGGGGFLSSGGGGASSAGSAMSIESISMGLTNLQDKRRTTL